MFEDGAGDSTTKGTFRVLREIGRGGMGRVYLARHAGLGRDVVVKVLDPAALEGGSDAVERFLDELEVLRGLDHPNLIGFLGAGRSPEHGPYLVCEFAEGGSLRDRLQRGAVSWHDLRRSLAPELVAGLGALHGAGIVHRDLKPENVLLDGAGRHRICDFGLAHFEGRKARTATGILVGTPDYMAPEQIVGRREAISPATDLFALALILVEAGTGRQVQEDLDPRERLVRRAREGVSIAELPETVPEALRGVLGACLLPDPRDRPTLDVLASALGGGTAETGRTLRMAVSTGGGVESAAVDGGGGRQRGRRDAGITRELAPDGGLPTGRSARDPAGPSGPSALRADASASDDGSDSREGAESGGSRRASRSRPPERDGTGGMPADGLGRPRRLAVAIVLLVATGWALMAGRPMRSRPDGPGGEPRASGPNRPSAVDRDDELRTLIAASRGGGSAVEQLALHDEIHRLLRQRGLSEGGWRAAEEALRGAPVERPALVQLVRCRRLEAEGEGGRSAANRRAAAGRMVTLLVGEGKGVPASDEEEGAALELLSLAIVAGARAVFESEGDHGDLLAAWVERCRERLARARIGASAGSGWKELISVLDLLEFALWGAPLAPDETWRRQVLTLLRAPAHLSEKIRGELDRIPVLTGTQEFPSVRAREILDVAPQSHVAQLMNQLPKGALAIELKGPRATVAWEREEVERNAVEALRAYWVFLAGLAGEDTIELVAIQRCRTMAIVARRLVELRLQLPSPRSWRWSRLSMSAMVADAVASFRMHVPWIRQQRGLGTQRRRDDLTLGTVFAFREFVYRVRDAEPVRWKELSRGLLEETKRIFGQEVLTDFMTMHLAFFEGDWERVWSAGARLWPFVKERAEESLDLGAIRFVNELFSWLLEGTLVSRHPESCRRMVSWYDGIRERCRRESIQDTFPVLEMIDKDLVRAREILGPGGDGR